MIITSIKSSGVEEKSIASEYLQKLVTAIVASLIIDSHSVFTDFRHFPKDLKL